MTHKPQKANIFAYASFDVKALLSIARDIQEKTCTCDESQCPKSGSLNWVIFIVFEDGVEWVFRSPRKAFDIQKDTAGEVLLSEVATLQYISEVDSIPVPRVFSYCSTGENDIGIPYILMSKAPGMPLSTYRWKNDSTNDDPSALTSAEKETVMKQLGEVYAALSSMRFEKVGSLFRKDGSYVPGRCLYPCLIWQGRDGFGEQDIPRGPFSEAESFYMALIHALLAHLKDLSMEHHLLHGPVPIPQEYNDFQEYRIATDRWNDYVAIGSKTDSTQNRLDYALVGIALKDGVPLMAEKDDHIKCDGFPLCHPDLSWENIFVDDDLNITCIIDWAFASSVPPSMLLVCPGLPHPRDPIQSSLRKYFAEAFVAAAGFDGTEDLDFSCSSVFWTFSRLVSLDALQDHVYFSAFIRALMGQEVRPCIHQLRDREEFEQISRILATYEIDDEEPDKDEKRYFECVGRERLVVAQHLTMIAEMNNDFVADKRLWKWIARYFKERDMYMHEGGKGTKRKFNDTL